MESVSQLPAARYTMIPNVILDVVMVEATPAEFVLIACICRKIFGFHKTAPEPISNSQLANGTGLSVTTVENNMPGLLKRYPWLILVDHEGPRGTARYALRIEENMPTTPANGAVTTPANGDTKDSKRDASHVTPVPGVTSPSDKAKALIAAAVARQRAELAAKAERDGDVYPPYHPLELWIMRNSGSNSLSDAMRKRLSADRRVVKRNTVDVIEAKGPLTQWNDNPNYKRWVETEIYARVKEIRTQFKTASRSVIIDWVCNFENFDDWVNIQRKKNPVVVK